MAQETFTTFLRTATKDDGVMQKLRALALEHGYDLGAMSEEQGQLLLRVASGEVNPHALSDQELDAIAGGVAKRQVGLSGTDLGSGR